MSAKIAAVLSSIETGAISAAGLLSRFRLVVSGNAVSTGAANVVVGLWSHVVGLVHIAAPLVSRAPSLVLHITLAPAGATFSLLAATQQIAFATVANAFHLSPLVVLHWV